MKLKLLFGLVTLGFCLVSAWMFLGATGIKGDLAPRKSKSQTRQAQTRSEKPPIPTPNSATSSFKEAPAQPAALNKQSSTGHEMSPLEIWPNRPTAHADDQRTKAVGHPTRQPGGTPEIGIRLSEDFRLPASILAAAAREGDTAANTMPGPIRDVSEVLIADFYQSIAWESSLAGESEPLVETDPETGELTRVIEPSSSTDGIRKRSDEHYRALFGDMAYNQFLRQSAIEKTLPVAEASPSTD